MGFVFRIFIGSVSEDMKILNQHTIFSKVYLYIDKYLEGAINPNPKVGYNGYYYVHSQTLASKYIYNTKLSYDLFVCSSVQGTKPFHHKGGGECYK